MFHISIQAQSGKFEFLIESVPTPASMTGSIVAFELDPLNYVDAGNHAATQNVYFSESLKKADRLVIIDGSLSLFMIDVGKSHVVKE